MEVAVKEDPIVAEVHRIRAKLARESDYDIAKMLARHRRRSRAWKGTKVTEPFHPEWRAPRVAAVAEERAKYGNTES